MNTRYTIQDFHDISNDGFDYTLSEATLDIISALASQVGAPDYVRTPNFTTHRRDARPRGGAGGGRRRRQQEMSDSDWEDLRAFHSKPKAELTPEKALERKLRGELNKVVGHCGRQQLDEIAWVFGELVDAGLSDVAERVFYELATCSKMNVSTFASLFVELVSHSDEMYDFISDSFRRFVSADGKWMKAFDGVEYVDEEKDYDRFCDVNRVNDLRLNMSRFVSKTFQLLFEKDDDRFFWVEQIGSCYWKMFCGFKEELRKDDNEDVAMIFCSNIVEFMNPLGEYIAEIDDEDSLWSHVIEDHEQVIVSGQDAYPSLTKRVTFAIQGAFGV